MDVVRDGGRQPDHYHGRGAPATSRTTSSARWRTATGSLPWTWCVRWLAREIKVGYSSAGQPTLGKTKEFDAQTPVLNIPCEIKTWVSSAGLPTVGKTNEFDAQTPVLNIPLGIKIRYSPSGFMQCSRSACCVQ